MVQYLQTDLLRCIAYSICCYGSSVVYEHPRRDCIIAIAVCCSGVKHGPHPAIHSHAKSSYSVVFKAQKVLPVEFSF